MLIQKVLLQPFDNTQAFAAIIGSHDFDGDSDRAEALRVTCVRELVGSQLGSQLDMVEPMTRLGSLFDEFDGADNAFIKLYSKRLRACSSEILLS